ncbi:adenylyl cyclase-associated protein 1-like isoform X2 [Saccostrea echinata]|uniref:adenylyl cyclase-associated protein 1-like isoform X2 n=1 Tax=Saccostrea echinata TaxID=191078 RepID=UPI002A82235C|nr:adenylyl cyclase-associated protein 1-like isoform X2 [Saccostrea echinata]
MMCCCAMSDDDEADVDSLQTKHQDNIPANIHSEQEVTSDTKSQTEGFHNNSDQPEQKVKVDPKQEVGQQEEVQLQKEVLPLQTLPGQGEKPKLQEQEVQTGKEVFGIMSSSELQSAVNRLEAVATRLETLAQKSSVSVPSKSSSGGDGGEVTPSVSAFDEIMKSNVDKFVELSNKIQGDVKTAGDIVQRGFKNLRDYIYVASRSKKPSEPVMEKLFDPVKKTIEEAVTFKDNNRPSKQFNHLSAIAESLPALCWVRVSPTPGPYVKDMQEAGQFYTNRVLKEFKDKDQTHVDWVKTWNDTLNKTMAYIKEFHTTGLSWNPQGGDASEVSTPAGGAPVPPPPGPPPPPPPPAVQAPPPSSGPSEDDARAALMEALNKGTEITAGLKKVTDDMKTHKNPTLRQGPKPFKASAPQTAPKPGKPAVPAPVKKNPAVFELQDKRWAIEYQEGNKNLEVTDTNLKQTVYAFKCNNCTIKVSNKLNSITLDSCKKTAIVFDDVVSSLEFINCQSVQGQVMGKVPTISIDKTDGCLIYLSKDSLDTEIVTAKSSEMNILVPKGDGDFTEFALPEQFKTTWDGKKFVTVQTDIV